MKKFLSIFCIFISLLSTGCLSTNVIGINTVKSYEGRYDKSSEIIVNGQKINLEGEEVVWIVRGETLSVIMSTAADKKLTKMSLVK